MEIPKPVPAKVFPKTVQKYSCFLKESEVHQFKAVTYLSMVEETDTDCLNDKIEEAKKLIEINKRSLQVT